MDYKPKPKFGSISNLDKEEAWLISRYASTLDKVTSSLDKYEPSGATAAIKGFIVEDLSRFYLKMAKKKLTEQKGRKAARIIDTINYVLRHVNLDLPDNALRGRGDLP